MSNISENYVWKTAPPLILLLLFHFKYPFGLVLPYVLPTVMKRRNIPFFNSILLSISNFQCCNVMKHKDFLTYFSVLYIIYNSTAATLTCTLLHFLNKMCTVLILYIYITYYSTISSW